MSDYIKELCDNVVSPKIPFMFTSNSNKPSHVANNLFRRCLGKKTKMNNLHQWFNVENKKKNIVSSTELLNKYNSSFAPNTTEADIKFFRSMLNEIFNQDNTMYPSEVFSCVTSTSEFTVKNSVAAEQGIGDFIYEILHTKIDGKESIAIKLISDALKDKNNAFSSIIMPLCDNLEQEQIVEMEDDNKQLNRFEMTIRSAFDCLSDNLIKQKMHKNSILLLQRMVSLTDFCALFYFININNIDKESEITPMLFDIGSNLNSIVRSSHETYIIAKKNIEDFFTKTIYEELKNSLNNTDNACRERIASMPIDDDENQTKRNALERLYNNKLSNNDDYLMNLAKALQEVIYTYEFKNCTPGEFLSTCLGVRNGVIGPKGGNAIRRFYPGKFIIENILLSSLNYNELKDGIEYTAFGDILREKYNIIVGINNDVECGVLENWNVLKNTPGDLRGDLHKNSQLFANVLITLGYGKKYADGVTMIGCDL